MTKIARAALFLTVYLSLLVLLGPAVSAQVYDETRLAIARGTLSLYLRAPGYAPDVDPQSYVQKLCMDAGESALPLLERVLRDGTDRNQRRLAALGVAAIGGLEARRLLQEAYARRQERALLESLCLCLGSTGTPEDARFLIANLGDPERITDRAILALGVLRAREALPALRRLAGDRPGITGSLDADYALRWIEAGAWSVALPASDDPVIESVLRHGLPNAMEEGERYYDAARRILWQLRGRTWEHRMAETLPGGRLLYLRFDVRNGADGQRAICSVGISGKFAGGAGFDYYLRRVNGIWRVTGIVYTWVA